MTAQNQGSGRALLVIPSWAWGLKSQIKSNPTNILCRATGNCFPPKFLASFTQWWLWYCCCSYHWLSLTSLRLSQMVFFPFLHSFPSSFLCSRASSDLPALLASPLPTAPGLKANLPLSHCIRAKGTPRWPILWVNLLNRRMLMGDRVTGTGGFLLGISRTKQGGRHKAFL